MGENQLVIHSPDGTFHAYVARPAQLPAPAVVVLQELFGVNADIRATCDELAAQGFIAIAPDLFWRQEPGVDLDVASEAAWQHGLRLYSAFDRDAGVRDAKETVRALPLSWRGQRVRLASSAIASACSWYSSRPPAPKSMGRLL
jgi:carboxymethylenebutenolidase